MAHCQGRALCPGGIRKGAVYYDITFCTPRATMVSDCGEGVLIELVQAPADVIAALG